MTTTDDRPLVTMSGADLAISEGQHSWTSAQIAALNQIGLKDAPDPELQVFFHVCAKTGLDPFAKQIYMIARNDPQSPTGKRWTIQTGVDGGRLVAQRAARRDRVSYGYEDTLYRKHDGTWTDCWDDPDLNPVAVKVTVLRDGQRFPHLAHWREFVQLYKGAPNRMWAQMPSNQLAKCAEMGALRKAFPLDLSGIYEQAELANIDVTAPDTPNPDALPVAEAAQALYERALAAAGDSAALAGVWSDGRASNLLDEVIVHEGIEGKLGNLVLHLRSKQKPEPKPKPEPGRRDDPPVDVQDADVIIEDPPEEPARPVVDVQLPNESLSCGCSPDEVWISGHRVGCPTLTGEV